jgi:hypothetical protein
MERQHQFVLIAATLVFSWLAMQAVHELGNEFGSPGRIGDAGDLLRYGAPIVLLWLFGVITIPVGLWMWNGLGAHFGLGEDRGKVDSTVAYVMLAIAIAFVLIELAFA